MSELKPWEKDFKVYEKKPVLIKAKRITRPMTVETPEGTMKGNPGDWLIIGVAGEEYFCKDDIFRKTYCHPGGVEIS